MRAKRRLSASYAALISIAALALFFAGCKPTRPWAQTQTLSNQPVQAAQAHTSTHDLSVDESYGGHTLKRHVGRSDQQLQDRLQDEPNISAASTYTDSQTAETVIANAIESNHDKIGRWLERARHPNLVLDYHDEHPVGRTLNRGEQNAKECSHAIVVLHWDGPNRYHVLTSYPECR